MRKINYFSTFLAGGGEFIEEFLKTDTQALIHHKFDGIISYGSDHGLDEISRLKYFNNSYLELADFDCKSFAEFENKIVQYFRAHGRQTWDLLVKVAGKGKLTYRLMFYDQNHPVAIDKSKLNLIEEFISSGELVDRTHPAVEISAMLRSEGVGFLGIRLTYHPDYKNVLSPGELRPEISEILCRLSDPKPGDIFLDPFAGNGAIVAARHKYSDYMQILCGDVDEEKVRLLKKRFGSDRKIIIKQADVTNLNWIKDEFVNKIVIDPPWGNFDRSIKINLLYRNMFVEFYRVLSNEGILVILTAARKELEEACQTSKFVIIKKWDVLISGRQASIYKIQKRT